MITRNFLFIGLASAQVATADEAVKQHLATGADANAKNERRWTPLHHEASHAIISDGKEFAELLIANGADVNAIYDNVEQTPLHRAVINGNYAIDKLLITKGTSVNKKDKHGRTPLLLAIGNGNNKEIGKLLIGKGADVNAKDNAGGTPLDGAIKYKHPETADLLRKHNGNTGEELKTEEK